LSTAQRSAYNRVMSGILTKAALVALTLLGTLALAATHADAQRSHHRRTRAEVERPPPPVPIDKRDTVVAAPSSFAGKPYWLALAECGGVYFKLNTLYTDAAVHARVVHPDPHANAIFTKKLQEAISMATTFYNAAEKFLTTDRNLDRDNAVLTYDGPARAAGDSDKTIDAALATAKACPALYEACQTAYPKACSGSLVPLS
jgi:hypothetical protein